MSVFGLSYALYACLRIGLSYAFYPAGRFQSSICFPVMSVQALCGSSVFEEPSYV